MGQGDRATVSQSHREKRCRRKSNILMNFSIVYLQTRWFHAALGILPTHHVSTLP